jgi:hypothetical protein
MALALALPLALAWPGAGAGLRAEPAPRPPDLRILQESTSMREGTHWLGVYGRQEEPGQPGLWRVKIWREWSDRVELTSESIDCRPGQASRVGVAGGRVVVQSLNPGGVITPANRLDHLIWWATCVPEQAGRDPAGLAELARRLGFDGQRQERFEVLPAAALPHP